MSFLSTTVDVLKTKGLMRELKDLSGAQGSRIYYQGKEILNFCSNNYLGLANDPRVIEAAQQALNSHGFGSGASRLVCGSFDMHHALEQRIALFKDVESALLFNSGYTANVGIISSLCSRKDVILCDKLNHASIIDGIMLSRSTLKRYPHRDMDTLEQLLKESQDYEKRLIVTDGVFSMDGDIAPLDQIVILAKKYQALVMVDDAHGFGVLGNTGRGTAEHLGIKNGIDIHMGTLSKAVGSFGAYVGGRNELIQFLINKARSFIYTTALPACVAAASFKALEIMDAEPDRRQKLLKHLSYIRQELSTMGFDLCRSQDGTPIVPVLIKDADIAVEFSHKLFEQGVFVQAIRPPTVPEHTARLRLTVMATHSEGDIDQLLSTIKQTGKELCLI